jgi:hypothetical protein
MAVLSSAALLMVAAPAFGEDGPTGATDVNAVVSGTVVTTTTTCNVVQPPADEPQLGLAGTGVQANFSGIQLAGVWEADELPANTYAGTVNVANVAACVQPIAPVPDNPLTGRGSLANATYSGGPGLVNGNCLSGSIKDGEFVQLGLVALAFLDTDFRVYSPAVAGVCNGTGTDRVVETDVDLLAVIGTVVTNPGPPTSALVAGVVSSVVDLDV